MTESTWWLTCRQTVNHPCTNRAQHKATTLNGLNVLSPHHPTDQAWRNLTKKIARRLERKLYFMHRRTYLNNNNNNNNSHDNVYGAVIVAVHCHCESSPGSSAECSTPSGRQPLDQADKPEPIDPPIGSYSDYIHHHHLLLLSPKADTHFTIPWRVEG